MRPATTLVFPTLRECPPTTMIAMKGARFSGVRLVSAITSSYLQCKTLTRSFSSRAPGQLRQGCQFLQVFLDRTRRRSPEYDASAADHLLARNAALGTKNRARLNAYMIGDSNLAADNHLVLNNG